ncbi:MAG: DUF4403 family protein [Rhizobiales bacterium]|nr:DUF4403 family protein [Hyphomicrobiales bacterium]MBN9010809.1 DUF4403 family protein [Hyphomicrobiales bacterium]
MRKFATFAVLLLAGLLPAGCIGQASLPPDVAPVRLPIQATERIPVNIRTSWQALTGAIEAAIPRCAGASADGTCPEGASEDQFVFRHEDDWLAIDRSMLGQPMGVRIAVWRVSPIAVAVSGNHVTASLKLLYRMRVGLMSGRQLASCGLGEAPRELTVKLDGDLRFAPQWYLDPDFRLSLVPGARCAVSFLGIDVTDAVMKPVRKVLQEEADDAAGRIREVSDVRELAAAFWTRLNQPMAIGEGAWFLPNLSEVHIQPPQTSADGRYLGATVAVEGVPKVVIGARPVPAVTPLPTLTEGPVAPVFSVKVRGFISYPEAAAIVREHLASALAAQNLPAIRLASVSMSGRGENVVVALQVHGFLSGKFYLFGVPRFESTRGSMAGGKLTLDHPRFSFTSDGPFTTLVLSFVRQRIQRDLEAAAWWDVTPELQRAMPGLEAALNRELTPEARLEGRLTEFGPGEVRVGPDGLEAWYRLGGQIGVVVAPLN